MASQFGALDTAAISDGHALHSHALRTIAMTTHRLAEMPSMMVNMCFDSSTDLSDESLSGTLNGYQRAGYWQRMYPGPVLAPKKRNARTATFKCRLIIPGTLSAYICVETSAASLTSDLNAANVLKCTGDGTGTFQSFTLNDVPLGTGGYEPVSFWIAGDFRSATASTVTYGAPGGGSYPATPDAVEPDFLWDSGAAFNVTGSSNSLSDGGAFAILFVDRATGNNIIGGPYTVTMVETSGSGGRVLRFMPYITTAPQGSVSFAHAAKYFERYADYEVRELNTWRCASLTMYSDAGKIL